MEREREEFLQHHGGEKGDTQEHGQRTSDQQIGKKRKEIEGLVTQHLRENKRETYRRTKGREHRVVIFQKADSLMEHETRYQKGDILYC